ncbi:multicopper oxidase domain-containing protein [Natrinema sp. 1APR25-10V2]|uniref:multicopper oxidase domain-containing protein n=1 Tax=Natrinema sp. 1APR25-10V2 TaxID=2951081 RepID=UPI0028750DA7|nr:multicopper oxidase domain-containing protein [Natrinema sp. 1APR25-10V2]MDS0474657.1 multicopper oxidase domain-containing protein [Natrinema sp. 1APR25-10V2]
MEPGADASAENWLYDGEFPGPELRVSEGDVIETEIANDVSEGTTIHWHGIPVPNAMDGVPNVTQPPISPGETFTYKFRAEPAGTYFSTVTLAPARPRALRPADRRRARPARRVRPGVRRRTRRLPRRGAPATFGIQLRQNGR